MATTNMFVTLQDAFEVVIALARKTAATEEERAAVDTVEDYAVNELGDE